MASEAATPAGSELLKAAELGHLAEVRNLLDRNADLNVKSKDGLTPLHQAAKGGHYKVAELLLEYGADPNIMERSGGFTALHYATRSGHHMIVQLLLDYWADRHVTDKLGYTPLHYASEEGPLETPQLLLGEDSNPGTMKPPPSSEGNPPMFPIKINGNTLDQSIRSATTASTTNYVLVQCQARLSDSQRQELTKKGVLYDDYVAKNTYLCNYEGTDLNKIRQMACVVYVDVYRPELKMTPDLKAAAEAAPSKEYKVDVIFHNGVDSDSQLVRYHTTQLLDRNATNVEYFGHKMRLTISGEHLDDIVSIDEARRIEQVGVRRLRNDSARTIMGVNVVQRPSTNSLMGRIKQTIARIFNPTPDYGGMGQVIAIADTGFDMGDENNVHPAFTGRVDKLYAMDGDRADSHGHGTHVCGSAVGDGRTRSGRRIAGTAPDARLVVQCIGNDAARLPGDLGQLFKDPYKGNKARVHSNSWGKEIEMVEGIPTERGYDAGALEIDTFVWKHPDMMICWAAGNDASYDRVTRDIVEGQIGFEAAAKNCITVGACENFHDDVEIRYDEPERYPEHISLRYMAKNPGPRSVAAFSSRGPTEEDRIKPDIVAPGTCILSTSSRNALHLPRLSPGNDWHYDSGTSMATPLVAGCAAVLRQALVEKGLGSPSAALIKALLINGADNLSISTPNPHSGFGLVNLGNSMMIARAENGLGFYEGKLADGDPPFRRMIVVTQQTTLKVTLVWSDPPGKEILNRLLLAINNVGVRGRNNNNIQQVLVENLSRGPVELVVGILMGHLQMSPQPFALVWRFL